MANIIYVGSVSSPLFTFTDNEIMSITNEMAVSVIADELSADVFEAEVVFNDALGELRAVPYATKIFYYNDTDEVSVFFFTSVKRTGKQRYLLCGTSFVGLFENEPFYGGMFFGSKFSDVVRMIVLSKGYMDGHYLLYRGATLYAGSNSWTGTKTSADGYETGATTKSRVQIGFKINELRRAYLFGETGIYRAYIANPYGNYYYFYFINTDSGSTSDYRTQVYLGSYVEVDIIPSEGTATIKVTKEDGTVVTDTKTFTAVTTGTACKLSTWMCVFRSSATTYYASYSDTSVTIDYYKVYDDNGNLIVDDVAVLDIDTNQVYPMNRVTGYMGTAVSAATVSNDGIMANENPSNSDFIPVSEIDATIYSSISYGDGIADKLVYGWLASGTKREALYQLMFAYCINLIHGADGLFVFDMLSNDVDGTISQDSIYNVGSVQYQEAVKEIDITVNSYDSYGESTEIFNNESEVVPTDPYIVEFNNAPIYGTPVAASGTITIIDFNCNTAVVTGKGSITGTPYVHGKTVISEKLSNDYRGKNVSISDATMVTFLNYPDILNRLKAYYTGAVEVESNLIFNNTAAGDPLEKTGKKYGFTNVFEEEMLGFLSKLSLRVSNIVTAITTFICNYIVPDANSGYTHYTILTRSGTWAVPEGVTKFRAILIGGGTGGASGYAGKDGDNPRLELRSTVPAEGGMYGESGASGKILEVDVTNPSASYSYSCGSGGAGGAYSNSNTVSNAGADGTATTFGEYSSDNGTRQSNGVFNVLTGKRYAYVPSVWNESSGKGGRGGYSIYLGNKKWQDVPAENVYNILENRTYYGGAHGNTLYDGTTVIADGSGGDGAAIGQPTGGSFVGYNDGGDPAYNSSASRYYPGRGGRGGGHSTIYRPPKQTYGCGGIGGVGGGGGGAVGCINDAYPRNITDNVGQGGYGSYGGNGGDGCVIIYY